MKTADLIDNLAADGTAASPSDPRRGLGFATLLGGAVALAILLLWLGHRPMPEAFTLGSFWMKASYTAALAVAGWVLAARLSRPAASTRAPLVAIAAIFLMMAAGGAMQLMTALPEAKGHVWMGDSWNQCPFRIVALAVAPFVAAIWVIRGMAPTRLASAGAAAGLLAGAAGATVYGLYCDETTAAFTATWYSLGIAACAAIGAVSGPRLLRW